MSLTIYLTILCAGTIRQHSGFVNLRVLVVIAALQLMPAFCAAVFSRPVVAQGVGSPESSILPPSVASPSGTISPYTSIDSEPEWEARRISGYDVVRGQVIDASGQPASGVDVGTHWIIYKGSLSPSSWVVTDSQGKFELPWSRQAAATVIMAMDAARTNGGFVIVAGRPKEEAAKGPEAIDSFIDVEIAMAPLTHVSGSYWTDEARLRPRQVWTSITCQPDDIEFVEQSDRSPFFSLLLPPGNYRLRGSAQYFEEVYHDLHISSNDGLIAISNLLLRQGNEISEGREGQEAEMFLATGADSPVPLQRPVGRQGVVGSRFFAMTGHTDAVAAVEFIPNSFEFVTAGSDSTIRFWNPIDRMSSTRVIRCTPQGTAMSSYGGIQLFVSQEGSLVGGYFYEWRDNQMIYYPRLWRAETNFETHVSIDTAVQHFGSAAVDMGGRRLGTFAYNVTTKLERLAMWDVPTGKLLYEIDVHGDRSKDASSGSALKFSPDGRRLAIAGDKGTSLQMRDTETGKLLWKAQPTGNDSYGVNSISFSREGSVVASASWGESVDLRATDTGQIVGTLRESGHRPVQVAISPNGRYLATAGTHPHPTIKIWDIDSEKAILTLAGSPTGSHAAGIAWSPDGQYLVSVGGADEQPGQVLLWDLAANGLSDLDIELK